MKNYGVSPYASGSGYLMVNDRYFDTLLAGPSWPPFDQCCAGAAGDDRGYESTTLYINGGPEKQPNKLIDEEGQTPPGYKE